MGRLNIREVSTETADQALHRASGLLDAVEGGAFRSLVDEVRGDVLVAGYFGINPPGFVTRTSSLTASAGSQ